MGSNDIAASVQILKANGVHIVKAIEHVAKETGLPIREVSSHYYRAYRNGVRRDAAAWSSPSLTRNQRIEALRQAIDALRAELSNLEGTDPTEDTP